MRRPALKLALKTQATVIQDDFQNTGKYRGIKADGLRAYDHSTLDGQSGTFTLDGVTAY